MSASVALFIQHAKRMPRVILACVTCPALSNISTLYEKRNDVRKTIIGHQMCVLSLHHLSGIFRILRGIRRGAIINVYTYCCKVPLILVRFLIKLELSGHIFENYSNIKFYKIASNGSRVAPCRQTERHEEANSRYSQFFEFAYNYHTVQTMYTCMTSAYCKKIK